MHIQLPAEFVEGVICAAEQMRARLGAASFQLGRKLPRRHRGVLHQAHELPVGYAGGGRVELVRGAGDGFIEPGANLRLEFARDPFNELARFRQVAARFGSDFLQALSHLFGPAAKQRELLLGPALRFGKARIKYFEILFAGEMRQGFPLPCRELFHLLHTRPANVIYGAEGSPHRLVELACQSRLHRLLSGLQEFFPEGLDELVRRDNDARRFGGRGRVLRVLLWGFWGRWRGRRGLDAFFLWRWVGRRGTRGHGGPPAWPGRRGWRSRH